MTRKQAITCIIIAAIPTLFVLVLLGIFFLPAMLLAILLIIMVIGLLSRRYPEFFGALRKQEKLPAPIVRPTEPPQHTNVQRAYMMLIGLNASNQHRITVDSSSFVIGRSKGCNFILDDQMVSRHHLTIEYDEDAKLCYVIDRSANGTFLNSERLQKNERYALKQGDNLQIANTVFSVEYAHF